MALIKLSLHGESYEEIDEKISHAIRNEDYVGVLGNDVYVLLPDVNQQVLEMVKGRFQKNNIDIESSEIGEAV